MTAAAARKLQKEIDGVLKKVDDGISEFADCFDQATAAGSNQQKEKFGEELKRSINKLQRFRVQIREWLAQSGVSSEAKDKLEDARKRVEYDMQRFKELERELKTKAFSTCALARGDELELEEAEKIKYQEWLTQTIQSLNDQLDQFEADLELMGNKKSLSTDDKARQTQLRTLQEQHRWHVKKLEQVLRGLDNDAVELSDLAVIRDSIDYYVDNNQEPDCLVDDSLFECFDLAEYEDKAPPPKSPCESTKAASTAGSQSGKDDKQTKAKDKEKRRKDEKKDKKREEREKKTSVTQKASTGSAKGKDAKGSPDNGAQGEISREQAELDEIKVQEDQLLSEAAEFICKICQVHVAGCGPKLTSCSHLFCGDCIAQWFNQHPDNQTWAQRARSAGPDRVVPCPVCKQPLNEKRDLYPVCGVTSRSENLLLWRMLSSLKIVCANHTKVRPDGKCGWVGEYGSYQKHAALCKNLPLGDVGTIAAELPPAHQMMRSVSVDSDSDACSTPMSRGQSEKSIPNSTTPSVRSTPAPSPSMAPQSSSSGVPEGGLGSTGLGNTAEAAPAHSEAPVIASPSGRTQGGRNSSQQAAEAPSAGEAPKTAPMPQPSLPPSPALPAPTSEAIPAPQAPPVISPAPAAPALATQAPKVVPTVASTAPAAAIASAATAATTSNSPANGAAKEQPTSTAPRNPSASEAKAQGSPDGSFTAHAVSSFEGAGVNMVTVHTGDLIQVLEQHSSGWTYAKNLSLPASSGFGWIPSWIVPHAVSQQAVVEETKESAPPQPKPQAPQPVVQPVPEVVSVAPQAAPTPVGPTPPLEARPVMRASATFAATSPSQLTLKPADFVEVVERHASGWTYGRKVSDVRGEGAIEGWFPEWVVAQK